MVGTGSFPFEMVPLQRICYPETNMAPKKIRPSPKKTSPNYHCTGAMFVSFRKGNFWGCIPRPNDPLAMLKPGFPRRWCHTALPIFHEVVELSTEGEGADVVT